MVFDFLWAILMLIASAIVTDLAKKYEAMDSFAAAAVSYLFILNNFITHFIITINYID